MPNKTNCYECIYRRDVPGSAHSRCTHTAIPKPNHLEEALAILGVPPPSGLGAAAKLGVRASQHGIRMGWFLWPVNFDPVWLESCNGFQAKEPHAE